MKAYAFRYEEILYMLEVHFQGINSLSEHSIIQLCEMAIDRTIKDLTELQTDSTPTRFLPLIIHILQKQGISIERLLSSRILSRIAIFIRIYEKVVQDSAFKDEYAFFKGFCE
jgi:hypothetical protein